MPSFRLFWVLFSCFSCSLLFLLSIFLLILFSDCFSGCTTTYLSLFFFFFWFIVESNFTPVKSNLLPPSLVGWSTLWISFTWKAISPPIFFASNWKKNASYRNKNDLFNNPFICTVNPWGCHYIYIIIILIGKRNVAKYRCNLFHSKNEKLKLSYINLMLNV